MKKNRTIGKLLKEPEDHKNHARIETGARITIKTERRLLNQWGLRGYIFRTVYEGATYRIYHFIKYK